MDGESGFRLGDVHRCLQQDFRLRTEPVLVTMAVGESAGFKQLVGTALDQVIYFLRRLDKWVAKGEARRRGLRRSHGGGGPSGVWVRRAPRGAFFWGELL